jgi:hypothetical protein
MIQVTNTNWNHMECSTCVEIGILIKKAMTPEEKQYYEKELDNHWEFQGYFRQNYSLTVMKVNQDICKYVLVLHLLVTCSFSCISRLTMTKIYT